MKCPYCGSIYYTACGSYTIAACYPPTWKDGVNVNPDRNRTTTTYRCLECGKEFVSSDDFKATGNQNEASIESCVTGTGEPTKNESAALDVVGIKDANSVILIKPDKLLIQGDCFEITVGLAPDKLKRFKKIIINGVVFVKE